MRKAAAVLSVLVAALSAVAEENQNRPPDPATQTNPAVPAFGHSLHGESFDDGPRQRAIILSGMGKVSFRVTTGKPLAQSFVNQGVAQLHSFYYFEAERSFREAAVIDSGCALVYWGMAMANVNNPKRAKGFLSEARSWAKKSKLSQREQLYLDALSALYEEGRAGESGQKGLVKGFERIVQEFPDDLDARAWMVLALEMLDNMESRQAADVVLESVLRVEPMHPGAHHYRIHLWDHHDAERALSSAATYAKAAPGIAHAWHMPGHTYSELKRYADTAYHQEAAARTDHTAMNRNRVMPFEIHNYVHNNQWLCTSYSHVGRAHDAIIVARNLTEIPRDPEKNAATDGGSAQRSGRLRWAETLIRYELWDELIAATMSGALDWSEVPFERMMRCYSLGLAYAARGDSTRLADQIAALRKLASDQSARLAAGRAKLRYEIDLDRARSLDPAQVAREITAKLSAAAAERSKPAVVTARGAATPEATTEVPNLYGDGVEITVDTALAELEGQQLLLSGDVGAAFVKFSVATAMRPEARARAHLNVRNYAFAETTAKLGMERAPGQVSQLATYLEVLYGIGKEENAANAYRELAALAKQADRDLPVFRRLDRVATRFRNNGTLGAPANATVLSRRPAGQGELESLGPLVWSPYTAPLFSRPQVDGEPWALSEHRGRIVLVLLYLGGRCAHCMKQLQLFGEHSEELKSLGAEIVAVGTDDEKSMKSLKENTAGIKFPMTLLADPNLEVFKANRSYDEFEDQALHGILLIDGRGYVRYQRVSADPFLDVEFIKSEIERVRRLTL